MHSYPNFPFNCIFQWINPSLLRSQSPCKSSHSFPSLTNSPSLYSQAVFTLSPLTVFSPVSPDFLTSLLFHHLVQLFSIPIPKSSSALSPKVPNKEWGSRSTGKCPALSSSLSCPGHSEAVKLLSFCDNGAHPGQRELEEERCLWAHRQDCTSGDARKSKSILRKVQFLRGLCWGQIWVKCHNRQQKRAHASKISSF